MQTSTARAGHRRGGRLLAVAGCGLVVHTGLTRVLSTWGATGSEASARLAGDDLVAVADGQQTMAVSIAAPPERVWRWLVQMGVDRAGLYSATWVENGLLHLGVTNADRIHPEWQDLAVRDIVAFVPDGYPGGRRGPRVVALEAPRHLVLDVSPTAPEGTVTGTWQFVLREDDAGNTRLLFRTRSGPGRSPVLRAADRVAMPGYLLMERAMLLGLKERAEAEPAGERLRP